MEFAPSIWRIGSDMECAGPIWNVVPIWNMSDILDRCREFQIGTKVHSKLPDQTLKTESQPEFAQIGIYSQLKICSVVGNSTNSTHVELLFRLEFQYLAAVSLLIGQ